MKCDYPNCEAGSAGTYCRASCVQLTSDVDEMTTQPEAARVERGPITKVKRFALGMAALLERQGFTIAAVELRRLHAQRDALLEALQDLCDEQEGPPLVRRHRQWQAAIDKARAAIKAVEENT